MPTNLVDRSDDKAGEVWGGFGMGCVLKHYYTGTVCFPAASEFGCGDEKEVGKEKEESLELKIGAESHGVGVDLTIGTKTTNTEKWTIKSKECQWCKPEICFPDSRIEVWTCSTALTFYYHDYDKTYFYPGPRSQNLSNCGPDREGKCGCKNEEVNGAPSSHRAAGEGSSRAMRAMLITPISFDRMDQEPRMDSENVPDEFASLYEQDVLSPRFGGAPYAIGVSTEGEFVNWVYPAGGTDPHVLSLLSRGRNDLSAGGAPSPFRGRFLPVLAATRYAPDLRAYVSAKVTPPFRVLEQPNRVSSPPPPLPRRRLTTLKDQEQPNRVSPPPPAASETFDAEARVKTGPFTLIWAEIDFGRSLEPGSTVDLQLKLTTRDNYVLTYTSRSYIVLA